MYTLTCVIHSTQHIAHHACTSYRAKVTLLYHYNTIDDNLNGSFEIVSDYVQLFSKSIKTAPAIYDLNNDGWNDMLIGVFTGGVHLLWGSELSSFSMKEESNQNSVVIYPNPSPSIFNIKTNKVVIIFKIYLIRSAPIIEHLIHQKFLL